MTKLIKLFILIVIVHISYVYSGILNIPGNVAKVPGRLLNRILKGKKKDGEGQHPPMGSMQGQLPGRPPMFQAPSQLPPAPVLPKAPLPVKPVKAPNKPGKPVGGPGKVYTYPTKGFVH